ncbi:MAG: hypothetical protein WAS33_24675 [Candidatus Promineifilaceae bacterium]|nr:hypothetical protein [Anaerolineaceae bacterium]
MRKLFRFNLSLFLWLLLFVAVGCGRGSDAPDPTQPEQEVVSAESAYIIGRWEVNDGRFGHKIFDFQEDGRLLIEDVESPETIEMSYLFVAETSLVLSGYDEFNGAATVAFFADKMDFTITFDGSIFAELYEFTRLPEGGG